MLDYRLDDQIPQPPKPWQEPNTPHNPDEDKKEEDQQGDAQ